MFKSYNPIFPELFEKEKQRIISHIKKGPHIEHVGSTAVPNLGGKGIIDIAIAVDKKAFQALSSELQELGYVFNPKGSTPDRLFFYADLPDLEEGTRRYHIHLTPPESKDWEELIAFRNYLRNHPLEAEKYTALKKQATTDSNEDGETYRKLKAPFFERVLKKK